MNEPVAYMARSRAYYEAQGFAKPYLWAHFDEVPFSPLAKPLAECTLGLVTTAATYPRAATDARRVDTGSTTAPPEHLHAEDLFWDKDATHLDDPESYFPLRHLQEAVAEGRLGAVSPRFYCAPTSYSQRATLEVDAPEILRLCTEDGVDVALLVPL